MKNALLSLCVAVACSVIPVSSFAGDEHIIYRYALVVGNSDYAGRPWEKLKSPVKDAKDVAKLLEGPGYRYKVKLVLDAPADDLRVAVRRFINTISDKKADIAERRATKKESIVSIFYWSGHGFSRERGSLFLAAVDATGAYYEDVVANSQDFGKIVEGTATDDNVEALSFAFVDACRTRLSLPSRLQGVSKGSQFQGNMLRDASGTGSMILYASRGGQPSRDGDTPGVNSLFTQAFLDVAKNSSESVGMMQFAIEVADRTKKLSIDRNIRPTQNPWFEGSPATDLRLHAIGNRGASFKDTNHSSILLADASREASWAQFAQSSSSDVADGQNTRQSNNAEEPRRGWIWAGNYTGGISSKEAPGVWTRSTLLESTEYISKPPAQIEQGTKLEAAANLVIRDEFPALGKCSWSNYANCYVSNGIIERGKEVRVIEKPRVVTAGKHRQVWIRVEEVVVK